MAQLSGFHQECIALLQSAPRTHATHCLRSALHHLDRAEALRELDPAMAIFRAITAEEEAASGVMRCLMELKYSDSHRLNPHDHTHKHAVFPYLEVLELFFGQAMKQTLEKYHLHIRDTESGTRLTLAFKVALSGEQQLAYPVPPLNFSVTEADTGAPVSYTSQIDQLVAARGRESVRAFLKSEANVRNEILYAGPKGYPVVQELDPQFIEKRRRRVMSMVCVYLLVYPYEHQPFVTQALAAFIKMLSQLKRAPDAASQETPPK